MKLLKCLQKYQSKLVQKGNFQAYTEFLKYKPLHLLLKFSEYQKKKKKLRKQGYIGNMSTHYATGGYKKELKVISKTRRNSSG
ncbi:unnamed protein product [Paramecium primaurelia]|uniref:Uncharacterized protein n=1 Tax=Paramecium primaurelia TaxID=5886 RepID=A0A8S1LNN4_PARPR|nr:unnamed protein product [Paramecium primaurelia]